MKNVMLRIFRFVRSMKFGLILLLVVAGFSVVGSFIPQVFEEAWYLENYPVMGEFVVAIGAHRMFSQWYFVIVCVLLGISLAQATISRLIAVRKLLRNTFVVPQDGYHDEDLNESQIAALHTYLKEKRYKAHEADDATVYHKNRIGYFGSILVHFSILAIFLFGGLVLFLSDEEDVFLLPRETVTLADGSHMHLFHFTRYDETGRADSRSIIEVITPEGRSSGIREISVNHPLRFNSHRFYQVFHLFAGSITAMDLETGERDTFYFTDGTTMLSMDGGRTGVWLLRMFEDWEINEDGAIVLLFYETPHFPNPIYEAKIMQEDFQEVRLVLPGSYVDIGNIRFEFDEPIRYPGIRVAFVPHPFPALLYISFGLLLVGLYLAFYRYPSILVLKGNKYRLSTLKSSGIDLDIKAFLKDDEDALNETSKAPDDKPKKSEMEVDI
jgi:cytochrome c biogenesis protein